jgi:hypothetical protein
MPWLFPVPARRSRFRAGNPDHARFNIEVAHDRLDAFAFAPSPDPEVLHYDLQTQITGNARGRLGSGRGGVWAGHYLKGVGRTPAAANWNEPSDLYHASGHLSVGSALRERTITRFLQARGLGHAIVPCVAVLLRSLTQAESNAIATGRSSSCPEFAAADATHAALTAKPADFARLSNIAFALDHFVNEPQALGTLFLEVDRFLRPPEARDKVDGEPRAIAEAMAAAYHRGLANFHAFARAGLFWLYLESNVALDGRFLDLETPLYFGGPFVGLALSEIDGVPQRELIGFEEFGFTRHWRAFVHWFTDRLRFLQNPLVVESREARAFLRSLEREITRRVAREPWMTSDDAVIDAALHNLAPLLAVGARDRTRLHRLAREALGAWIYGRAPRLPDTGWTSVLESPAAPTPRHRTFQRALFSPPGLPDEGAAFATTLSLLGRETDPRRLLRTLASH